MKVFRSFRLPENFNHSVLAIGNFDGVHLGHQMVIEKAKEIAKESLNIAADVCIYTNHNIVIEEINL